MTKMEAEHMDRKLEDEIQEAVQGNEVLRALLSQRDEARLRVNLTARAAGDTAVYPIPDRYRDLWASIDQALQPVTR